MYLVVLKHREDMGVHIRLVDNHLHGWIWLGRRITSLNKHQPNTLYQLHLYPFKKAIYWIKHRFSGIVFEFLLIKLHFFLKIFKYLLKIEASIPKILLSCDVVICKHENTLTSTCISELRQSWYTLFNMSSTLEMVDKVAWLSEDSMLRQTFRITRLLSSRASRNFTNTC